MAGWPRNRSTEAMLAGRDGLRIHKWRTHSTPRLLAWRKAEEGADRRRPSCMYGMRMARVNVYLPDEMAERARAADLNVSGLTQEAIRRALDAQAVNDWLDDLASLDPVAIDPSVVRQAVRSAKDEFGLRLVAAAPRAENPAVG